MPKNIVVDTSCLVVLEKIDALDVLQKLYEKVFITDTIAEEFGSPLPEWIQKKEIENKKYQRLLQTSVDPGEASAIALVLEIGGLLIVDDIKARRIAEELSLDFTGTLGVLVEAKQNGHLNSFKEVLKRVKRTNFYLSEELERNLLNRVRE
ncbi:MAG: DUF3368 domain-containing protein [Balneolaceae bacterium]|nr:DUF3368 domain-containing protein [Balneolaceae bacterium]